MPTSGQVMMLGGGGPDGGVTDALEQRCWRLLSAILGNSVSESLVTYRCELIDEYSVSGQGIFVLNLPTPLRFYTKHRLNRTQPSISPSLYARALRRFDRPCVLRERPNLRQF